MRFNDNFKVNSERRLTRDGYMVVPATISRLGVFDYHAQELGLKEQRIKCVARVFHSAIINLAMLIARDQSSKLNAALTQARHESLGITHYEWSTSGDERVRDSHSEKDGRVFEYANPPEDTGNPGHDIICRCVAIPVLDNRKQIIENNDTNNRLEKIQMRSSWSNDFPDTVIDRALGDATTHPDYVEAKAGDIASAYRLANDLVTDAAVEKLRAIAKNHRDVVIVPVHALESVGVNAIPIAIAKVLSDKLKLPIELSIVQATKVSRTGGDG